jgi:hypothetical protein
MYSGVPLLFTRAQEELLNIPRRDVLHFHYEAEQPTLSQQKSEAKLGFLQQAEKWVDDRLDLQSLL